jgi:hypothetical protein
MGDNELPRLGELNGRKALFVGGEPFLILGLQWDCDSCFSPGEMDPLFPEATKMGCNSAALLLYWRATEPQEGRYDFALLDHMIEQARLHDLEIVLVWFGTYHDPQRAGSEHFVSGLVRPGGRRDRDAPRPSRHTG